MTAQLHNDPLDDLFNHVADGLGQPRAPVTPPATYQPATFEQPCQKCRGTGRFIGYTGRVVGDCFACEGKGKKTFKTSPADRAKARTQAADRKADAAAEALLDFRRREPQVFAWLNEEGLKANPFEFAVAMTEAIAKYGDLTEKQLETCRRLTATAAERKAHRDQPVSTLPQVNDKGVDRLKAAFDLAASKGKRTPRITLGNLTLTPAKANSANPGAIYAKDGETYLGKIIGGHFRAVAACTAEQQQQVLAFVADPKAAAEAYGQETGTCCICNAELTNPESIARGIGPICAEKYGW